jgi:hypothetical protein
VLMDTVSPQGTSVVLALPLDEPHTNG